MDIEGRLVQAQEDVARTEAQREAFEQRTKLDFEQMQRDLGDRDAVIQGHLEEIEALRATNRTLNGELTRLTNELEAERADALALRGDYENLSGQKQQVDAHLEEAVQEGEGLRDALEATKASLIETEEQAARAFERIRRDGETKTKVRQALDIALRLLTDPEEENGVEDDVVVEEARL